MMVIMKPGHTREEFDAVMSRIKEVGLDGHPIIGVERTVIGVVGLDREHPELADDIEVMPGVEGTVPISSPFKLCSREFRKRRHDRQRQRRRIGEGTVTVMAGPCAVESEEQLMATAQADEGARRVDAARRRLQAAHVAVQLPRPRGGRPEAAGAGARRRPACPSSRR